MKSRIRTNPIKRFEFAAIDISPMYYESYFTEDNAELFGAVCYVSAHKKQVDKLIREKKQELKEIERLNIA